MKRTVYLDNAATSFPKPKAVSDAVLRCIRYCGGNPGRSGHRLALAAQQLVYDCRCALADFFHTDAPERVVFTHNATYALNLALQGILRPGDHVLISDLEHNAVLRPLHRLQEKGVCTYDCFSAYTPDAPPSLQATLTMESIRKKLRPNTRVLCCTHTSNLCGVTLPLPQIGALCQEKGILFIVDAAQGAGHQVILPDAWGIDALCLPAHKGLYGISGCGAVLFSQRLAQDPSPLEPLILGGSGGYSLDLEMPALLPEHLEAGTLATPAIAGLLQGIRFLQQQGIETIAAHETALVRHCKHALLSMKEITVYAPQWESGTLLFAPKTEEVGALSGILDRAGICCRSGFHCAPLGHRTLQTTQSGALRISFGAFNTRSDADALISTVYRYRNL